MSKSMLAWQMLSQSMNVTVINVTIINVTVNVGFNLNDGTYKPYTKPSNEINYIHKDSHHPPSVIRQTPLSIESRLSTLSFNPPFQKAWQNSGYRHTLTYKRLKNDNNSSNINQIKQNKKQQIIWFNSPFNLKTKTKISKLFLNLLDKYFLLIANCIGFFTEPI